jgi:hypothetical protein
MVHELLRAPCAGRITVSQGAAVAAVTVAEDDEDLFELRACTRWGFSAVGGQVIPVHIDKDPAATALRERFAGTLLRII